MGLVFPISDWFRGIYILVFFYFTFRTFRSSVLTFRAVVIVPLFSWKHFGRTDGQTERPTIGHPVQRTHPLMERKNTSKASLMSCATIYHCKCSISPFFTKVLCTDQPTDRGADWQKDQRMDQWTDWEKDQRMWWAMDRRTNQGRLMKTYNELPHRVCIVNFPFPHFLKKRHQWMDGRTNGRTEG